MAMDKLLNKLVFLSLLLIGAWGCMEDLGNYDYDYESVIELEIDTTGMDQTLFYGADWNIGDTIEIQGFKIKYNHPENLAYYWLLMDYPYETVTEGNSEVWPPADTICRTLDLNYIVDLEPGQWYQVYLMVRDTVNGRSASMRAHFNNFIIVPEAGALSGVYCLQEIDGRVDVDIFGTPLSLVFDSMHVQNYWSENHPNDPLEGNARSIHYSSTGGWYYIFTDSKGYRCSPAGLTVMEEWNDMFYSAPEYDPQAFVSMNGCDFLINAGKLHCLYLDDITDRKFPAAVSGEYDLAPFLASETVNTWNPVEGAINAYQVVFDETTNGFRPFFNRAVRLSEFGIPAADVPFNVNAMEGELIYTAPVNGGETMAVMKREDGYWMDIACFYDIVDDGKLARRTVSLAGCPDIDKASAFMSSNSGAVLFYAVGNKLYSFSYTTGQTEAVEFWTGEVGEEITCMSIIPSGGFPTGGRVLWVAVWNQQTEEGKVLEFEFSPSTGKIEDMYGPMFGIEGNSPYVYNGFGKIISMCTSM